MKKSIYLLLGLFILFSFNCYADEVKTTAAVMDLEAKEGVSAGIASMLSDYLRTQLVNTNRFTIVTRENMEQVLKEQAFQLSGCTSQECIVQAGQLLGVRKMFTGSIGKLGATYLLSLKIIDVQSGQIERAETEECAECKEDALLVSIRNVTNKIVGVGIVKLLEEKPKEKGRLSIISTPQGAEIFLDGKEIGFTPISEYECIAGKHQVLLTREGYENQTVSVEISPNALISIKPALKAQTGSVNITSNPAGAQVLLDGEYKGFTPLVLSDIPVGEYFINLKLKGHLPIEEKITVSYKEETTLKFNLKEVRWSVGGFISGGSLKYEEGNIGYEVRFAGEDSILIPGFRFYYYFLPAPFRFFASGEGDFVFFGDAKFSGFGYAIEGLGGVEWFIGKKFSLIVDYGLAYGWGSSAQGHSKSDWGDVLNIGLNYYF